MRQLVGAAGRLAEPERDIGRHALRVLDPHRAALDPQDAVGGIAELEDVAGHALDREILVDRADYLILGLEQHLIVRIVRDRAAGGQRGQPSAAPAAQLMVHRIIVNESPPPAAARAEPVGQHRHHRGEILARQRAVRPSAAHERVEVGLVPFLRRDFGDDLLGEHVERLLGDDQPVELAAAHTVEQGCAFDELVARQREQTALGGAGDCMPRAPDALQEAGDRARRAELAHQIDIADVDAELERSGRDQRFQRSGFQPLLGVEALLFGEAAMMRGHPLGAEPFGELARYPLGETAGIDEDQGRAMLFD